MACILTFSPADGSLDRRELVLDLDVLVVDHHPLTRRVPDPVRFLKGDK